MSPRTLFAAALVAVALLGVIGFVVSVWFMLAGAPDVALTLLLVEVLTAVVIVLVLRSRPKQFGKEPTRRKLPAAAIAKLEEWVKRGAPDPRVEPAAAVAPATSWEEVLKARRQWWSLKPVVKPAAPTPKNAAWSADPVDRFILAKLEEAGLTLSNVVATNVYLDDINDFPRMNRIYAQYFPDAPPARTTVAQVAPTDRKPRNEDTYPSLEQISLIAVK